MNGRRGALAATAFAAALSLVAANVAVGDARNSTADLASPYLVLTASSLDAFGLSYAGTFTVPRPSGTVEVLRFDLTSGALAAVNLTQACADGATTVTTADSVSLGSTEFDVHSLAMTVGGTRVTFTVDNPPTTPFPHEVVLQDITLTATTVSADSLSMPSFSTRPASC